MELRVPLRFARTTAIIMESAMERHVFAIQDTRDSIAPSESARMAARGTVNVSILSVHAQAITLAVIVPRESA